MPASRFRTFSTIEPGQRTVQFTIYQGEAPWVADNIALGSVEIPVPVREKLVAVNVRFTYDVNGLLEVDVTVPETGETRQVLITGASGDLSAEEIAERRLALAALKVPPRETEPNRAALARGARCYETSLGEKRGLVATWLRQFEVALDAHDPHRIDNAREHFLEQLDSLEGESYL